MFSNTPAMILYIQLMCQPFWRNSLCRSGGRVNLKTKECFIFATFLQKIWQNLWPLSSFPPYCLPASMHQDKSTGYFFGRTLSPVWSLPWRCRDLSGVDPAPILLPLNLLVRPWSVKMPLSQQILIVLINILHDLYYQNLWLCYLVIQVENTFPVVSRWTDGCF